MNSREYVNKFLADFNIPRDQVRIKKGPYETYSSYIEPGYYGLYIPEETAPHYRELEAKKAEYNIGHYETVTTKWGGGRGAEWKTLVTIKCAEDNHNTKLEEGMSYTDEVIRFIQSYNDGSMWDEFVVAFEGTDDADLDASDIIEWMQNYPDMYDAFLTEGDDYNDDDDIYEALNRAHELDEAAFSGDKEIDVTTQLKSKSGNYLIVGGKPTSWLLGMVHAEIAKMVEHIGWMYTKYLRRLSNSVNFMLHSDDVSKMEQAAKVLEKEGFSCTIRNFRPNTDFDAEPYLIVNIPNSYILEQSKNYI